MQKLRNILSVEKVQYVETIFKIVYIVHLLASFNIYITGNGILNLTLISTVLLGAFVLFCRVMNIKLYFRTPGIFLLIAFMVSFAIPSFLIYRYDVVSSLKTAVWMTFQFAILYCFSTKKEAKSVKKDMLAVGISMLIFITLENIMSLVMLVTGFFEVHKTPDGGEFVAGISWWGRLFGIHTDPNYSCVYSIVVMLFALYMFIKFKKAALRILLIICIIINFLFVSFTASRTGVVCSVVGFGCFATFTCFARYGKKSLLKTLLIVVVTCIVSITLNKAVISGYNYITTVDFSKHQDGGLDKQPDNMNTIGRTDEELGIDISNRRFEIWQSGVEIFTVNPVLGIGFENVLGYAEDKLPDTYIVNNDLSKFDAFHNTVVDILVSQGIVGIITALWFAINFIIKLSKGYNDICEDFRYESALSISVCITVLVSAMFLSHVFFVNIPTTFIFWLFAGYLAYFFTVSKNKTEV